MSSSIVCKHFSKNSRVDFVRLKKTQFHIHLAFEKDTSKHRRAQQYRKFRNSWNKSVFPLLVFLRKLTTSFCAANLTCKPLNSSYSRIINFYARYLRRMTNYLNFSKGRHFFEKFNTGKKETPYIMKYTCLSKT